MKNLKKIFLIAGITLAVALLLMVIGNKMKADIVKEKQSQENYSVWLSENCNCVARNLFSCPTGFTMKNQTCVNEAKKSYTNKLAGCSEYNCSGEIKLWNRETEKWEN
jgi:hypothetical protein